MWNHAVFVLCVLMSLSIMVLRLIQVVAYIRIPFLFMAEQYSTVTHSSVDGYLDWWKLFAIVNNAAVTIFVQVSEFFKFFLDIHLGVKLLNHMLILYLIFWGTSDFSTMAAPFYNPTSNTGFHSLHFFTNTYCFCFQ